MKSSQLSQGYKNTELGVIPEDWEIKELSEISKFKNGKAHEQLISNYGDYVVVNSKFIATEGKIFKRSMKCMCPLGKGDITMVMSDIPNGKALAKCYLILENDKFTLNQRICSINSTELEGEYLSLALNRNKYFLSFDSGTGQTNLTKPEVLACPILVPSTRSEQKAIAQALSDTDALIGSLEQLIAKKRHIKQGAMQELLRPKEGWVDYSFSEVCWFQEGPGVRNHQFTTSGVKLFNGTNIEKGKIDLEKTNRYISESEAFGWYSHFMADTGDIVIACSGISVDKFDEKVAILEAWHLPLCMNTSTMRFKVMPDKIDKFYLQHFLRSGTFKEQIGGKATGSAQLNFGPSHVSAVKLELPDIAEQNVIATILSDMDTAIAVLEDKLTKTRQLKQGMMHELLTGRIRLVERAQP
jgi:type I restriction enzyme, S subunit